jgi:hypothetical protein
MPNKFTLTMIAMALVATAWYAKQRLDAGKPLVSKADILHGARDHSRRTAKLTGPINVNVELDSAAPVQVGDVYRLVGYVATSQSIEDVNLKWIVPPSAEIVSGQEQQAIRLVPDQEFRAEITLRAKTNGPQKVNLKVSGRQGDTRFGASSHYTNKPAQQDFSNKSDALEVQSDSQPAQKPKDQRIFR